MRWFQKQCKRGVGSNGNERQDTGADDAKSDRLSIGRANPVSYTHLESPAVLKKLVKGGANVFRLNFSHGDHAEHAKRIQDIQTLRKEMNMPIGIMLDTKESHKGCSY